MTLSNQHTETGVALANVKPYELKGFGEIRFAGPPENIGPGVFRVWYQITFDPSVVEYDFRYPNSIRQAVQNTFHGRSPAQQSEHRFKVTEHFLDPIRSPRGLLRHRLRSLRVKFTTGQSWDEINEELKIQEDPGELPPAWQAWYTDPDCKCGQTWDRCICD